MRGKRFGPALAAARRQKGFATPYAFYKAAGAARGLGCTFANYLALERGSSLPQPRRLKGLLLVLGLEPSAASGRQLLKAYLCDHFGGEEMVEALGAPTPTDPVPQSWSMAESLSRETWKNTTVHLSLEQLKVLAKDSAAYACHLYLKTAKGAVSRADLPRCLGLPAKGIAAALRELEKARLVKRSGDKLESPYAGLLVPLPPLSPATASLIAKLGEYRSRWASEKGRPVHNSYLFLRTTGEKIKTFQAHLDQAVKMAAVYLENERKPGTAIYLVEGQVTRLFD